MMLVGSVRVTNVTWIDAETLWVEYKRIDFDTGKVCDGLTLRCSSTPGYAPQVGQVFKINFSFEQLTRECVEHPDHKDYMKMVEEEKAEQDEE